MDEIEMRQVLAQNIQSILDCTAITRYKLALNAKISPRTLSAILLGSHGGVVDNLVKIAAQLNVDPYMLLLSGVPRERGITAETRALLNVFFQLNREKRMTIINIINHLAGNKL